jgi:hypothetical protein
VVNKEQFNLWKHDPVTRLFVQFLQDKRKYLIDFASEQWVGGSDTFSQMNQTVRGQVVELGEIAELEFETIKAFYTEENDANDQSDDREPSRSVA